MLSLEGPRFPKVWSGLKVFDAALIFVYTLRHIGRAVTTSVGIWGFRAGLASYIDDDEPVIVTRHGQTVGTSFRHT